MTGRIDVEPIGVVRSPVWEGVDADWGEVISEIHLWDELTPGLVGLDTFSHVSVIFWMHRASFNPGDDLVRRPQGREDMPEIGIFAQRARHRPNPIGFTAVRLLSIAGNVLRVQGLDAVDGTPVLDIKPYFPQFDRVRDAVMPEWVSRLMKGYF